VVARSIGGIDHDTHLTAIVSESFVQNYVTIVFDHRGFDSWIQQQPSSAFPIGAIRGLKWSLVDPDALCAGKAGASTVLAKQLRNALRNGTTTAPAGDSDEWDAAGGLTREQMVDDGFANGLGKPVRGFEVHQEARTRIDLNEGSPLFSQRAANVLGDEINPCDVESDNSGGKAHLFGDLRVYLIRDIKRDIAISLNEDFLTEGGNGVWRQTLPRQFDLGSRINSNAVKRVVFGGAPARV